MLVADKLRLSGAQAKAYAKKVVISDFEQPGEQDVFWKIRNDFDAKKIALSDHEIRRTVEELMAQAAVQIKASS
jgi:hypothetical protein